MSEPAFTVIVDGQWGSTGKGKLADWLVNAEQPVVDGPPFDAVVCDYTPNAGHTVVHGESKRVVHQLPAACCFNPKLPVFIGPGSSIHIPTLLDEMSKYGPEQVIIHEGAGIVDEHHVEQDRDTQSRNASTGSGSGPALSDKILRVAWRAGDQTHLAGKVYKAAEWFELLMSHRRVLVESCQGWDLSLDHGHTYPFVTSRNVSVPAILDRCGAIPIHLVERVWGSFRTYPIRVGDFQGVSSGPYYPDQEEISWDELGVPAERTTCTNRVRRVFDWSKTQFDNMIAHNRPTCIFLNFVNYWHADAQNEDWLGKQIYSLIFVPMRRRWGIYPDRLVLGCGPDRLDMREYPVPTLL